MIVIALSLLTTISYAQAEEQKTPIIKYVLEINYPSGLQGKQKYLAWVAGNVSTLKSFPEVANITSYDNYFGVTPHRLVEFYFDDLESAAKYWSHPKIVEIMNVLSNRSGLATVNVFVKRGEYQR